MVYAIGADPQMALVAAGHAANGAYWIYDHTGNWASTTYYKEMPASVSNRNYLTPLHSRLDTIKWTPSSTRQLSADLTRRTQPSVPPHIPIETV